MDANNSTGIKDKVWNWWKGLDFNTKAVLAGSGLLIFGLLAVSFVAGRKR